MAHFELFTTADRRKIFHFPEDVVVDSGQLQITALNGTNRFVNETQLMGFEVSEAEALQWTRQELGDSLTELRQNIVSKLDEWRRQLDNFNKTPLTENTTVTPEAGPVFYELLAALPKVFRESTSGDETQVESAKETMADLERRFTESGLDVQGRVAAFPERLAKVEKKSAQSPQNSPVPPPANR
jgi:hypothetical protein